MIKKILGSAKWILATVASFTGTVYATDPLLEAFGYILSTILTANTVFVIIPNKYWEPILVWLGEFISKKYPKVEEIFQWGSLRSFIIFAVKSIDKGMDKDEQ